MSDRYPHIPVAHRAEYIARYLARGARITDDDWAVINAIYRDHPACET